MVGFVMDKISVRIPEDCYYKGNHFEKVWKVLKSINTDQEITKYRGFYNDKNGLFQCDWNGNGILLHTNPNKVLKKAIGNVANWTESKDVVLSIIDILEKDAEIRVDRDQIAITRIDFNFDIETAAPYEKYFSFLQTVDVDGFQRGSLKSWKDTIFLKCLRKEIVCYNKYAEAQRPKYNGVPVVNPTIRFEQRNLYGGSARQRKPFYAMTEELIQRYRQEAKNDIQKMFFGLSVQENEELQEYLKQRASGTKESELIRIWGLKKIAEMVSGSGCSKEMLLRRPNADGATRARDSRLIQTLDNIIVEPVQAVYYTELKTKFAAVA